MALICTKMSKKLQQIFLSIIFIGILLVFARHLLSDMAYEKSTKLYPNFGIRVPNGYTIHGIDVSHYQKGINWELVKNMKDQGLQLNFAIIKGTEGQSKLDKTHITNWQEAKEQGLLRGAYLYFHPKQNVANQVNYFKKNTNLVSGDLAPIIDIEETNGLSDSKLQERLQECCDLLKEAYNCNPIIYCNADFYTFNLGEKFDNYPLWVAHYGVAKPDIDRDWQLWQHSDKGQVNGIDGPVDFNVANGSMLQLQSLCIK